MACQSPFCTTGQTQLEMAMMEASCEVVVFLTKAVDYGIVQLYVDGKKAGEPIDLFNDGVIPSGPIPLGVFQLDAGKHALTAEIVGANDKALKRYMFGLDRIVLRKPN